MHGVKRTAAPSASAKAARKEKEAAKLKEYLAVEEKFFHLREQDQLDEEALEATTAILTLNPELNTAWNRRRKVLTNLFDTPPPPPEDEDAKPDIFASLRTEQSASEAPAPSLGTPNLQVKRQLIQDDLELTAHALRVHPKVYWIWNHRKWCLINLPEDEQVQDPQKRKEAKWWMEMKLVDKMLELDPRNFHGWDYRRYLLSQIALSSLPDGTSKDTATSIPPFPFSLSHPPIPSQVKAHHLSLANSELAYTLRKIESNFSNFSAWHWRSKLFPEIWAAQQLTKTQIAQARDQELELLRQAMYTDPADQSVWLYHTWLVDIDPSQDVLQREITSIEELLEVEPDSKWCVESLSRYKAQLAKEHLAATDRDQADSLIAQSKAHLHALVQIDSARRRRYEDALFNVDKPLSPT